MRHNHKVYFRNNFGSSRISEIMFAAGSKNIKNLFLYISVKINTASTMATETIINFIFFCSLKKMIIKPKFPYTIDN
jgi:hypothetical protein